jgi:hypothetical protein
MTDPNERERDTEQVPIPAIAPPARAPHAPAIMQFFEYEHLPPHLQVVSSAFATLAWELVANLPDNPQREAALTKLLEAKDCAVRARLYK